MEARTVTKNVSQVCWNGWLKRLSEEGLLNRGWLSVEKGIFKAQGNCKSRGGVVGRA